SVSTIGRGLAPDAPTLNEGKDKVFLESGSLPRRTTHFCSNLLEKPLVTMETSESENDSNGHKSEVLCPILDDRFGANFM
ncbi:MAG: hypothetical protein V3T49_02430, partial [Dehalococcoidia bacterium]